MAFLSADLSDYSSQANVRLWHIADYFSCSSECLLLGKADMGWCYGESPLMTQSGHVGGWVRGVQLEQLQESSNHRYEQEQQDRLQDSHHPRLVVVYSIRH